MSGGESLRLPTGPDWRYGHFTRSSGRPSRPEELDLEARPDPCLSLSTHAARVIHEELPPFATISRFLLLPVDQRDRDANDLPSSLHGHYSASSLLQGSPPLNSASVLSPSWFFHLWLFRSHRSLRFPRSVQLPHGKLRPPLMPDAAPPVRLFTSAHFSMPSGVSSVRVRRTAAARPRGAIDGDDARETASTSAATLNCSRISFPLNCRASLGGPRKNIYTARDVPLRALATEPRPVVADCTSRCC